jgi:hypothetical protein
VHGRHGAAKAGGAGGPPIVAEEAMLEDNVEAGVRRVPPRTRKAGGDLACGGFVLRLERGTVTWSGRRAAREPA